MLQTFCTCGWLMDFAECGVFSCPNTLCPLYATGYRAVVKFEDITIRIDTRLDKEEVN